MRKRSSNPAFRVANNGRCSTAEWSGSRQQLLDKRAWMLRRLRFPPASSRSNTEPSSDVTTSRGPKKGGGEVECDHQKKVFRRGIGWTLCSTMSPETSRKFRLFRAGSACAVVHRNM